MRRTALMAMAGILAGTACSKVASIATPITTVAAIEGSDLFSVLDFALDSTKSTPQLRVYRAGGNTMGRQVHLRLWLAPEGGVTVVRLAMSPAIIRKMSFLLREPYAGLVSAALPAADTADYRTLLAQLRDDLMGVAEGKFLARDSSSASMPAQPTVLYLAFLNAQAWAEEQHGGALVRIDNLGVESDSATVLTVSAAENAIPLGNATDWVVKRAPALLGSTLKDVETSELVEAAELGAGVRSGDSVTFAHVDGKEVLMALTVHLNDSALVKRLVFTIPNPAKLSDGATATFSLLSLVTNLIPRSDSALVADIQRGGLLGTPGEQFTTYTAVDDVLHGKKSEAMFYLQRCMVHIRRASQDNITIEVERFDPIPPYGSTRQG